MKGNTKAFVFGLVVGAVAYHFLMTAKASGPSTGG